MFLILSISILANLQILTCNYLEAAANYQRPRLERNNIVNKGVWVRNKDKDKLFEKTSLGNVVFRPSSLDADRLLQTNFDAFANNIMDETPFVSAYVERARRSTGQMRKRLTRKSIKTKKLRFSTETTANIPNHKPTFVTNNYPYEVAILLNNDKNNSNKQAKRKINNSKDDFKSTEVNATKINDLSENVTKATETNIQEDVAAPKRSKKHNYGIDNEAPLEFVDDFNKNSSSSKLNRDIITQDDRIWHQNAPIPDTHVYEVMPKDKTSKPVSERGLIRVISMLTKTFKRIMKQHNEVKRIYDKFNTINEDFAKQVIDMNAKFQDFDSKYSDMIQFNEKLRDLEDKLAKEEQRLKMKHKEMDSSIAEFENQQKKFLAQQKQFYTIQKVMLAQNEKLHLKQSMIAKTQSEISHRQNNFARILKKTKQLFTENKKVNQTKDSNEKVASDPKIDQTTSVPLTFETVKLNLFSIPPKNKLSNQDEMIIKEKDQKPIDDLVYKYYFNNTFIDNLMKNKVFNHASNTDSLMLARNTKNKRNELETTILLPINPKESKSRVRRWLNNFYDRKVTPKNAVLKANPEFARKNDPFSMMAKSFCNEIGQNTDDQTLNWCVEKALRRLRFMDKKLFPQPVTVMKAKEQKPQKLRQITKPTTESPKTTLLPFEPTAVWLATSISAPISTPLYAVPDQAIFFPDNDELESNLKQYDLTPDTEGNVYYDGSLHLSDLENSVHVNTHPEINPFAVDLKSKRRAYFQRLNEDIFSRMKGRTF